MVGKKKFVFLEHTADIKIKLFGNSIDEIFENSIFAFSSYINSGGKIKSGKEIKVEISADNIESLLYRFLDELMYLLDAENFAVSSGKVKIKDKKLTAVLKGDSSKIYALNHVKAATYAEMYIKEIGKKKWEAQVVLDV